MRGRLEQTLDLLHECMDQDKNNPKWDGELLRHIVKAEYHLNEALDRAEATQVEAIPLTRVTLKSFKAIKQ